MRWRVRPSIIQGEARVPGDKSIGHRALMFAALAHGDSEITNLPDGQDVQSTARCLRRLGADIKEKDGVVFVRSSGDLQEPTEPLDCGNSGTSMRLLAGILAGQPFRSCLVGDGSLSSRPMRRIIEPLERMGARIRSEDGHAPLQIDGTELKSIEYTLPVASAQVKSAVLLAGLFASGETTVREPVEMGHSRDHTEIMLRACGVDVQMRGPQGPSETSKGDGWIASIRGGQRPNPFSVDVPCDPSSAAFLFAAAALTGGEVTVPDLLVNPTRIGFVRALQRTGVTAEHRDERSSLGENVATVTVKGRAKSALMLSPEDIPHTIDEIPLLVLLATQFDGPTTITGVGELRIKETDRIRLVAESLNALGAHIEECSDGFVVHGPTSLHGTTVRSHGDHRIGMMLAVAGLIAGGETVVEGAEAAAVSWPQFAETLRSLGGDIDVD